jgi:hypothetical protein
MKKNFKILNWGVLLCVLTATFSLSGCEKVANSAKNIQSDWVGLDRRIELYSCMTGKLIKVYEVLEKSIEVLTPNSVIVKQVNETEYRLSLSVTDALSSFENSALQIKADELCPEGFIKESQQAINRGLLLSRDCEFGQCSHQLNWAIKCKKLAKEPFSIFGKS